MEVDNQVRLKIEENQLVDMKEIVRCRDILYQGMRYEVCEISIEKQDVKVFYQKPH